MKDLFITICIVGLVMVIVLLGLQTVENLMVTRDPQSVMTPSLGNYLIFPDGWTPVVCDSNLIDQQHSRCLWVCVKDSVYRYCTPEIVKVEATEYGTR